MAVLPIQNPCVPPKAIAGLLGDVPDALLEQVDSRTSRAFLMAKGGPARGMRAMCAAIRRELGIEPTSTGRTRKFSDQYNLFLTRYDPVSYSTYLTLPTTGGKRRDWPEATTVFSLQSRYWRLKPGMAAAAVPSFKAAHVRGCADDMAELRNGIVVSVSATLVNWLCRNARTYGFAASLQEEPWHWQWVMGDTIPQAVLDYEAGLGGGVNVPEVEAPVLPGPEEQPPIQEVEMATAHIKVEGRYAEFIAQGPLLPGGKDIHALEVRWTGPGPLTPESNLWAYAHIHSPDTIELVYPLSTFRQFLCLVGHQPEQIEDALAPGGRWSRSDVARVG